MQNDSTKPLHKFTEGFLYGISRFRDISRFVLVLFSEAEDQNGLKCFLISAQNQDSLLLYNCSYNYCFVYWLQEDQPSFVNLHQCNSPRNIKQLLHLFREDVKHHARSPCFGSSINIVCVYCEGKSNYVFFCKTFTDKQG